MSERMITVSEALELLRRFPTDAPVMNIDTVLIGVPVSMLEELGSGNRRVWMPADSDNAELPWYTPSEVVFD